ncbi:MAG: thiaminase II [Candidatus Methanomethylicaceae archaeon]
MTSRYFRKMADHIWKSIFKHPFLQELREGTLPKNTFKFFISQDYLFLKDIITCLGIIASKAMDDSAKNLLLDMKRASETVEIDALVKLGDELGGINFTEVEYAPTCYAYTRHLFYTASLGSFLEAISSMAPCYWSYMEIGDKLGGSRDRFYDDWIKTYRSEEYRSLVSKILEVVDRAIEGSQQESIRQAMRTFMISSVYEYMFWDMAYKRESWIIGMDTK